jgi:hypothetical protein
MPRKNKWELTREDRRRIIRWQRALLSGEYKQTTGQLCKDFSSLPCSPPELAYCCLGVLCKIGQAEPALCGSPDRTSSWADKFWGAAQVKDPFKKKFADGKNIQDVYLLNDHEGWTFEQIAVFLEVVYNFGFVMSFRETKELADTLIKRGHVCKVHKISLH